MDEKQPRYQAWLLRLWPVEEVWDSTLSAKTVWRVTLEDVHTHTRRGFADLEHAFAFLQQHIHCSKEDCDEMD